MAQALNLASGVELWSGVGPERRAQLARLKIFTLGDLLLHRPRRYEDRRHAISISQMEQGEAATVRGQVLAVGVKWFAKRTKSVCEMIIDDGTARLHCRWWNLAFMEKYFHKGDEVYVYGKPVSMRPRTVDHPETEVIEPGEDSSIHINRIVPIYPLTEGLPQRWLRSVIWRGLSFFEGKLDEPWPGLNAPGFQTFPEAMRNIHFPVELNMAEEARRRLALDEFIALQVALQRRRRNLESQAKALACGGDNRLIRPFLKALGFQLTEAQTKVLRELRGDLSGKFPMRRLVQGDVGSGKTVVAACCALMTIESGFSVALMAPTEILAEQHYQTFRRWFEPLGIGVEMQTGSRKTRAQIATVYDQPTLTIGTHAMIESGFEMKDLGLVIIDEQHKFGVTQREKLVRKGAYPHLLVMTATPIPRTLGLTLYGDLDISSIDQMPAGRGKIKTFVRASDKLPQVWEFIRKNLGEGRQAYVVYPRVEEEGVNGVKAVAKEFDRLKLNLAPFRVGLLHGRLGSEEKEAVMAGFRAKQVQVLLATSIIEVGVDVANATVMLIENAEQFGMAQLHQLRGRIGRGALDSYCILVAAAKTPEATARLKVLERTNDGFEVAEADMKLRGPGELLGNEQSGIPAFRFGDLAEDLPLVERARALAREVLGRVR
jgi:ATP-dependent DNA helicase RecG